MKQYLIVGLALLLYIFASPSTLFAAQKVVSTMKKVPAVDEAGGYFITPALDLPSMLYPGDESASQSFEILGPSASGISIGRIFTSCSCIQVEASKRSFASGERATFTMRNVKPTTPGGQMYSIFIQVTSPVRATLKYDTFVQSDRFLGQSPVVVSSHAGYVPVNSHGAATVQYLGETVIHTGVTSGMTIK